MIGAHISFKNPMSETLFDAEAFRMETFQMFSRNARSMKQRFIDTNEIASFNAALLSKGFTKYAIHAPYAMNPASPEESKHNGAVTMIKQDMQFLEQLAGEPLYVLHPGSHMGDGSASGIERLSEVLHAVGSTRIPICVETMSGAGTEIGYTVSEMLQLMDKCYDLNVSITFDTCHVYAAGIDLEWAYTLLSRYVKVVHLNNSMYVFQTYKDIHANLTTGTIPISMLESFCKLVDKNTPIILETPASGIYSDLELLRNFVK